MTLGRVIRILSLGAGVQSTTVLLMSCHGMLPKIDCAIFADTGWEPKVVYTHLSWLEKEAAKYGVPVHRLSKSNIRNDALRSQVRGRKINGQRWASMPFHTLGDGGSKGMIRRQCTREYKIEPIDSYIRREILGLKPRQHAPKDHLVDQWFGISVDEAHRMRTSPRNYKRYCYPLIGIPDSYLSRRFSRVDCQSWLRTNYVGRYIPRSACVGCPYRSNEEWRWLRNHAPNEWADAIDFDRCMRNAGGMRGQIFLHRLCKPLDQVDLLTPEDRGQQSLWDSECEGMCGV